MPAVVVRAQLGRSWTHVQQGLRSIQGLDLALLIGGEHQGPGGRIQVQAHDVTHLLDQLGTVGQLKGVAAMRLPRFGTKLRVLPESQ